MSELPSASQVNTNDRQAVAGSHQTVSRVTRILEEVVYRPGSTYAEVTRALGAPKSSVYGFIRGLLAVNWLHEQDHRLYLGPAFFSLTIVSGHIRAGLVSDADVEALHRETGVAAFVGVRAGDHLIYVAEAGSGLLSGFEARSGIRRSLLSTAGGKALLATLPEADLESYLRRRAPEEGAAVERFLDEVASIRETGIAVNVNDTRSRTGVAVALEGPSGRVVAAVTLVGPTSSVLPRLDEFRELLKQRAAEWRRRANVSAREPI